MRFQNCFKINEIMHGYEGTVVKQKMEIEGRQN